MRKVFMRKVENRYFICVGNIVSGNEVNDVVKVR